MYLLQMEEKNKQWLVVRTRANQELTTAEKFKALSIEVFVPCKEEIRQRRDRKVVVTVPLVKNMVFIYVERNAFLTLMKDVGCQVSLVMDCATKYSLVIPSFQMEAFKMACKETSFAVNNTVPFRKGDLVTVVDGPLTGYKGEYFATKKSGVLLIRLFPECVASIEIDKSAVQKTKKTS